jgi:sugar/nucleoside kinase (ribokinase family)
MNVIITRGGEGVITVVYRDGSTKSLTVTMSTKVKKTTGAGDTLTGAICSFLLKGEDIGVSLSYAVIASRMTVESEGVTSVICDDLSS